MRTYYHPSKAVRRFSVHRTNETGTKHWSHDGYNSNVRRRLRCRGWSTSILPARRRGDQHGHLNPFMVHLHLFSKSPELGTTPDDNRVIVDKLHHKGVRLAETFHPRSEIRWIWPLLCVCLSQSLPASSMMLNRKAIDVTYILRGKCAYVCLTRFGPEEDAPSQVILFLATPDPAKW